MQWRDAIRNMILTSAASRSDLLWICWRKSRSCRRVVGPLRNWTHRWLSCQVLRFNRHHTVEIVHSEIALPPQNRNLTDRIVAQMSSSQIAQKIIKIRAQISPKQNACTQRKNRRTRTRNKVARSSQQDRLGFCKHRWLLTGILRFCP